MLHQLSIKQLREKISSGEVSPEEVAEYFKLRIAQHNPQINAFLTDEVFEGSNPDGLLAGVPFATKDNIVIAGQSARGASKILEGYISPYTATAVEKLAKAGAISLGRLNCDEFAMGSSTETSGYGPTLNPWDLERVPGGSSGGSAAAVAAGLVPFALGSDTGGSIRQPASFCGIVGLKPTYGRVSRFGLMALASSLDVIGPFTKTVEDAALVLEFMAGHDPMDATTLDSPAGKYTDGLAKGVKGLKVGLPKEYFAEGLDPQVADIVKEAAKKLEEEGAEIKEISLPSSRFGLAAYYIILPVEASANLSRYDGIRYGNRVKAESLSDLYEQTRNNGFGEEVKRRLMLGAFASSSGYYDAYYKKAQAARNFIKAEFEKAFEEVDCILTPTCPTTAFKVGEKTDDPLSMYLNDVYSVNANIAGIPGISIPAGFAQNLPVGVQLMSSWLKEDVLLQTAYTLEQSLDLKKQNEFIQ